MIIAPFRETMLAKATSVINPVPVRQPWPRTDFLRDTILMARLAYWPPEKVQAYKDGDKVPKREKLTADLLRNRVLGDLEFCNSPIEDSQAYVLRYNEHHSGSHLVFACRGTSSLTDALVDANIRLAPLAELPGAMVHAGFLEQFRALEPLFEPKLKDMDESDSEFKRLLCVGHSLGSAVAAIAAAVYAKRFPGRVDYVGCGTPRVGDRTFVRIFNKTVGIMLRLTNGRDPVNKVPLAIRFAHVGEELEFGRHDYTKTVPLITDLPDHMQDSYVRAYDSPDPPPSWILAAAGAALRSAYGLLNLLIPSHAVGKL